MLLPSLCYLSNTSKFETYGLSVAKWSSKVWILLENISGKMGAKIALEREVFVSYYGWMRHLFNLFFFFCHVLAAVPGPSRYVYCHTMLDAFLSNHWP